MKRTVLDTSVLIRYWRQRRAASPTSPTVAAVRAWAKALVMLFETDAIVTPVYVEVLAGVLSRQELPLTLAFLRRFRRIDQGDISREDWEEAGRLAQRVPKDGHPRDLGDCLIRAIANRLRHTVKTHDRHFPS